MAPGAGAAVSAYNQRRSGNKKKGKKSPKGTKSKRNKEKSKHNEKRTEASPTENGLGEETPKFRSKWEWARYMSGQLVNNFNVQMFIIFLIVVNSLFMGIATYDFVTDNPSTEQIFETIDKVFLIIFTIELGFQTIHNGFGIFTDGWLFFDFAVVMISWASDFMDGANLQVMRAFRIFRAFRLITRVKLMKDLVTALIATLPNMSAIVFLLGIISYIFAVMFTSLYKDLEDREDFDPEFARYFIDMGASLFTLFQLMTMDGWADICREIMEFQPFAWIPFVSFVVITAFVALNLVIAVICDAVGHLKDRQEEELAEKSNHEKTDGHSEDESENTNSDGVENDFHGQIDSIQTEIDLMKEQQEEIQYLVSFMMSELGQIPVSVEEDNNNFETTITKRFRYQHVLQELLE